MPNRDPAGPRVSLRRVVILFLFGAGACMALTQPGRWVAVRLLPERLQHTPRPPHLESAPVDAAFAARVASSFRELSVTSGESDPHLAPNDAHILERLAGLEHWTDCVVFECGTRPEALQAHGWSNLETCEAITSTDWISTPQKREWYAQSAWREWVLVLLDGQGRRLATAQLSALLPNCKMCNDDSTFWAVQPDTSETRALPAIRSFHRDADGAIVVR